MSEGLALTGSLREELSEVLRAAFTYQRFAEFIEHRFDRRLDDIAMGSDYREIMFKVIRESQREGWTTRLILAARAALPENPALFGFAQKVSLAVATPAPLALERMLAVDEPFVDLDVFVARLAVLEGAVCRVEVGRDGNISLGTGFLIAPDRVLTCAHVVEPVLRARVPPTALTLRFGYRRNASGSLLSEGVAHGVASQWLIGACEPGFNDAVLPRGSTGGLDYAVLRLARALSSDPPPAYISVGEWPQTIRAQRVLCVLQHPAGDPLKLTFGQITRVSEDRVAIYHTANTLPGSSGAPCFDSQLNLIALHQSGASEQGENVAISTAAVAKKLSLGAL